MQTVLGMVDLALPEISNGGVIMNREECLKTAEHCVNGERDQQYGNPENNFQTIAYMWSDYLAANDRNEVNIKPYDVACMLALLKIARIASGQAKADNWVDLAGYAACGCEIQTVESRFVKRVERNEGGVTCTWEPKVTCRPEGMAKE